MTMAWPEAGTGLRSALNAKTNPTGSSIARTRRKRRKAACRTRCIRLREACSSRIRFPVIEKVRSFRSTAVTLPKTLSVAGSFSWPESPRVMRPQFCGVFSSTRCARIPSSPRLNTTSPGAILFAPRGATTIASPCKMFGRMLSPCAVKRTATPLPNNSRQSISNFFESFLTTVVIVDLSPPMANGLHGARLRQKPERLARHLLRKLFDKTQRVLQRLRAVPRHKAARENFRGGQAARHRHQFVGWPLLQHINVRELRRIGRRDTRISVPRRPVHPDPAIARPQDNAVIAQNPNSLLHLPQPRAGALPRARMSQEKMPAPVLVHHAQRMYFQSFSARQVVNHQHFIQRIFQRVAGFLRAEKSPRKRKFAGAKLRVEPRGLI